MIMHGRYEIIVLNPKDNTQLKDTIRLTSLFKNCLKQYPLKPRSQNFIYKEIKWLK